jgi:hypothetical protein
MWHVVGMRKPIFVRPLTEDERTRLEDGLRSKDRFVLRRCQILLASARGERAPRITATLGGDDQTGRSVLRLFEQRDLEAGVLPGANRPKTSRAKLEAAPTARLRGLLPLRPRPFRRPTGVWTLERAAEGCFAPGITRERVSDATSRLALKRLGGAGRAPSPLEHE